MKTHVRHRVVGWTGAGVLAVCWAAGALGSGCGQPSESSPTPGSTATPDPETATSGTPQVSPQGATPTPGSAGAGGAWASGSSCDGLSPDTLLPGYFVDLDGDGFGAQAATCGDSPFLVEARGDCADGDPARYPGASDVNGDGLDSDCGGGDGPQPSVGLKASRQSSIGQAIAAAQPGETVWIGPGTYPESWLSPGGKNIKVLSTHGAARTTVDAQGSGGVFLFTDSETSETELRGFTLLGGRSNAYGGGIEVRESSPTLRELVIGLATARSGGGISLIRSDAHLESVTIHGCEAVESGGGIYVEDGAPTLLEVTLEGNLASEGGGLRVSGGQLSMQGGGLRNNSAYHFGGGASLEGVTGTLTAVQVEGNRGLVGGGLYILQSTAALVDLQVLKNQALGDSGVVAQGGGVFVDMSTVSLVNGRVEANQAGQGGGIFSYYGTLRLEDAVATGNSATSGGGGGLYSLGTVLSGAGLHLEGNAAIGEGGGAYLKQVNGGLEALTAARNTATSHGGGLYLTSLNLSLTAVEVAENTSGAQGGGLALSAGGVGTTQLRVDSLLARSNLSNDGGGVAAYMAMLTVAEATLIGNTASRLGGGVYSNASGVTLSNAVLSGNWSSSGGGGAVTEGVLSLPDAQILSNAASADGGGVAATASTLDLTGAELAGNVAMNRGGAVFESHQAPQSPSAFRLYAGVTVSGNYATYGAGFWSNMPNTVLEDSTVTGNQAWVEGGGYFFESSAGDMAALGTSIAGNYAAQPPSANLWWCEGGQCCGEYVLSANGEYVEEGCLSR